MFISTTSANDIKNIDVRYATTAASLDARETSYIKLLVGAAHCEFGNETMTKVALLAETWAADYSAHVRPQRVVRGVVQASATAQRSAQRTLRVGSLSQVEMW